MGVHSRHYGGTKGSRLRDRCSICATKYTKPSMQYVRLQNNDVWYDSRVCGACYNRIKHKMEIARVYSARVPMNIYNDLRNEHRTKRAVNRLRYGDL